MPEPGPYGPLQWSHPRPWSVWAFVVLYVVTAIYWTVFVSEGRVSSLVWVAGLIGVCLLWRGSKLAMIVSAIILVISVIASVIEVGMARVPGGHQPIVHVVEAALLVSMLVFLLLPQTRRFYNLEARRELT